MGSKCDAGTPANPGPCKATKHCKQMKSLWSHIAKCKDPQCTTAHCVSSRYVLSHYHRCKDQQCRVCSPVRDAITRHKEKSRAKSNGNRGSRGGRGRRGGKGSRGRGRGGKNAGKGGRSTKIRIPPKQRLNIRRFSTSMITGFTKDQIQQHIKSLQTDFSSSYTPQQLRQRLAPILKKLIDDDYGWVFNTPVDPAQLNLPDYSEIITRPMDLGTIKKTLENSKYKTPEAFGEHVRRVFNNAIMYNPEGEDVHTIANRLLKQFNTDFDAAKKKMGKDARDKQNKNKESCCAVCNGEDFVFETAVYHCNGKCNTRIRRNSHYYVDPSAKFHFCQPCYNEMQASCTMHDQNQTVVNKNELKKKKHDEESKEGWVECEKCKKWVHQICGLYNVKLDKNKARGGSKRSNEAYEFYRPQCCLD